MHRLCRQLWCLMIAVGVLSGSGSFAADVPKDDWPQFRGPGGLGVSTSRNLPTSWSATENVVWKTALPGPGTSSPIVVGDRVFLTCFSGYNVPGQDRGEPQDLKLHVLCLSRGNGEIQWNTTIAPQLPEQASIREAHGYASSTPVCDGERVYVFFGKTGVFAFDLRGQQLWQADVGSELNGWGSAASPVLFDNLVIVNASVESQSLVALNRQSGREVWRAKGIREAWNTPVLVPLKTGKHELVLGKLRQVVGFDPATGDELWNCSNDISWYIAPSVVAQNEVVWSIGGRSGVAAVAVKAGGRGDVTGTHRLWTSHKGSNVTSPIIHDGHLYWMHENLGIAYCAEGDTGTLVYEVRVPQASQVYASPVLADGKLYYISRTGRTFVLAAGPEYELLATNDLGDRSMFNASPAVTGSRLLIRSDLFLYCLGSR
jgi:outer membrane protein assembly factor BamB